MAESYQDIMSRLNGGQQAPQPPKAANDFATYVRTLLANPNPQGGMMGDAAGYYADPFRKQNAINQAILDEELRKKKEAEDAAAAAGGGGGMLGTSSGSDSGSDVQLTQEQLDFLEKETPEERYARITGDWFGLKPMAAYMAGGLPALAAQQGYTPTAFMDRNIGLFRQAMGDTSGYQGPYAPKPAGIAAPVVSGIGGTTYTPSSLQETMQQTGGVLTPQQAQAVVNYVSSGDSGGGGFGYGGQDGMGGQTDSALTGYTE